MWKILIKKHNINIIYPLNIIQQHNLPASTYSKQVLYTFVETRAVAVGLNIGLMKYNTCPT